MTEEPENLTLVYLRRLDAKVDRVLDEIADLRQRQSETHRSVLTLRREQTGDAEATARVDVRVDRLEDRMDRIERRLDLVD